LGCNQLSDTVRFNLINPETSAARAERGWRALMLPLYSPAEPGEPQDKQDPVAAQVCGASVGKQRSVEMVICGKRAGWFIRHFVTLTKGSTA